MDDDDDFSDDGIADLPTATLFELEQSAWAATQRQKEPSSVHGIPQQPQPVRQNISHGHTYAQQWQQPQQQGGLGAPVPVPVPARPPLLQRQSTSTSRASSRAMTMSRPATSFGDAELQNLDAGVLDDGAGPAPVERQDVIILDEEDGEVQQPVRGPEEYTGLRNGYTDDRQWKNGNPRTGGWQNLEGNGFQKEAEYASANYADENSDNNTAQLLAEAERLREQVEQVCIRTITSRYDCIRGHANKEQLTRDRESLLQELRASKSLSESKAGEIAIIRANQAKQQKAFDAQVSALRAAMAEQVRKHTAEVQATEMESKRLTTEVAFLRQDLREETFRAQQQALRKKDGREDDGQHPRTPSKSRNLPFRDGFDDDEIMASPSRSTGRRSNRGTPSGGPGKRKRKAVDDSPRGAILQLSQSFGDNTDASGVLPLGDAGAEPEPMVVEETRPKPQREDRNVRFMRTILNHKTYPHKQPDLEVFASLSIPSQADRSFSSFILEATATAPNPGTATSPDFPTYAITYAKAIISLWSRCLNEKFHKPISMFMSIMKFILSLDSPLLTPHLIADLIPVLRESAYVNGFRRFRHSPNWHKNRGQVRQTPARELSADVNGTEALEMLYTIASDGSLQGESFVTFWTAIRYDFILMMLNAYQPVQDIILILNLLSCSIATTPPDQHNIPGLNKRYTFGPIRGSEADQVANENYILERAANLLSETPSVDEGLPPCGTREITSLRLEVMHFLTEVAFSSPLLKDGGTRTTGAQLLLSNPSALARIFRSMHDELGALYVAQAEDVRSMHAELVNGLTKLAYGVLHSSTSGPEGEGGGEVAKLNLHAVPGAVQKHLVVLTRLAFSERGVVPEDSKGNGSGHKEDEDGYDGGDKEVGSNVLLEAGIDLETVEMAHEMLEEAVNPQEAEALVEAFRPSFTSVIDITGDDESMQQV